jgi:ribosomal protein L35
MAKKYKLKNKKSVVKRFKVRKSGKVQKRKEGQGHYNANDSALGKTRKKGLHLIARTEGKNIAKQVPVL